MVASFCLLALPCTAGDQRALLIGVQHYGQSVSDVFPDLKGPENDLVLMHETLRSKFGNEMEISTLGGAGAPSPTRQAILSNLNRLADNAGPGDEIIIYLSGHGTQLPSLGVDADEPDGFDEVFLPSDTELIRTSTGYGLHNHVRDSEFGEPIARMERAGSFVWLIVDSCHAGTMLRSSDTEFTPRMANLQAVFGDEIADLNPRISMDKSQYTVLDAHLGGKFSQDRMVAFYAAAPDALAFELPTGQQDQRVHGLFTISLVEALRATDALRFSDLARETSARMWARAGHQAQAMYQGALNTPLFGLDTKMARNPKYSLQFDGQHLFVQAGRVDGLVPGMILTVELGSSSDRQPVFTAKVLHSGLDVARLEIVADARDTPNHLPEILAQAGLPGTEFTQRWLADRAPNLTASPVAHTKSPDLTIQLSEFLAPALSHSLVQAAQKPSGRVSFKLSGAEALLDMKNRAFILTPSKPLHPFADIPIHIGSEDITTIDLTDQLAKIAASHALVRIANTTPQNRIENALEVQVSILSDVSAIQGVPCQHFPAGLEVNVPQTARLLPDNTTDAQQLMHCDQVFLNVKNTGGQSLDVSPLYVTAAGSIYHLSGYPMGTTTGLRVPAGASRLVQFTESINPAQSGLPVTILLLGVPSSGGSARDFRYLTTSQPKTPTPNTSEQTRSKLPSSISIDLRYVAMARHFISGKAAASGSTQ